MKGKFTTLEAVHKDGRWTQGGNGSHWDGCEETHWDCMLVHQAKEIVKLQAEVDRLMQYIFDYGNPEPPLVTFLAAHLKGGE
jgi:hypothetical protein